MEEAGDDANILAKRTVDAKNFADKKKAEEEKLSQGRAKLRQELDDQEAEIQSMFEKQDKLRGKLEKQEVKLQAAKKRTALAEGAAAAAAAKERAKKEQDAKKEAIKALKQKRDEVAARERAAAAERQALDLKIAALDNQQVCETAIHETPTETAGGAVAEQEALEDFGGELSSGDEPASAGGSVSDPQPATSSHSEILEQRQGRFPVHQNSGGSATASQDGDAVATLGKRKKSPTWKAAAATERRVGAAERSESAAAVAAAAEAVAAVAELSAPITTTPLASSGSDHQATAAMAATVPTSLAASSSPSAGGAAAAAAAAELVTPTTSTPATPTPVSGFNLQAMAAATVPASPVGSSQSSVDGANATVRASRSPRLGTKSRGDKDSNNPLARDSCTRQWEYSHNLALAAAMLCAGTPEQKKVPEALLMQLASGDANTSARLASSLKETAREDEPIAEENEPEGVYVFVEHERVMKLCNTEPLFKQYLIGHGGEDLRDEVRKQFKAMIKVCAKETPPVGRHLDSYDIDGVCGLRWSGEFKN